MVALFIWPVIVSMAIFFVYSLLVAFACAVSFFADVDVQGNTMTVPLTICTMAYINNLQVRRAAVSVESLLKC
jgi:hypothetical protein